LRIIRIRRTCKNCRFSYCK